MRRAGLCVVLCVAFAACGDDTGYQGPYAAEVRRAIPEIEQAFGQPFKTPPRLERRDRDQVREFVDRQFNEQLTPLEIAGAEQAYKRLGLLPDSLDLRAFLLELLTEQVAGYYDPQTKTLYVVDGGDITIRNITISHELVHALQDQYYPLDSTRALKGDNDRQVASQAVIEGQATYEQLTTMLGGPDFTARLPGGWGQIREMIRSEQASMPLFARAPMLIQETLLFPYLSGAEFVRAFKAARPGEIPFGPIAASTEQILTPAKYLDSVPDVPTRITLAPPRSGTLIHEDNLGEFETRLFLRQHLDDIVAAGRGAAGWDGDRYQLVSIGADNGIGWLTVWDSPNEATEFLDYMERSIARRFDVRVGSGGAGTVRTWSAKGRRLVLTSVTIAGRPAIIFEDVPAGHAAGIIALNGVTLRED